MSTDPTPRPIHAFDVYGDGTATTAPDLALVPAKGAAYRWLHFDLADPALQGWADAHLPRLAARSLLAAKTRPRVDSLDDGLIVTLRGINLNSGAEPVDMVSLRVWITPQLVVSVRRFRIFAMDDLRDDIAKGDAPPDTAHLLARISENLVERIEAVSVDLEDRADQMEEQVYENDAQDLPDLAPLHRTVIKLRRHIGPLGDALVELARIHTPLIPTTLRHRLRDNANRVTRSVEEVTEVRDRLHTLTTHLDLANGARLGRNSYVLSIIAAIFVPLGFLTGLFGVNLAGIPGATFPYAFAILCGAMALIGVAGYLTLRWLKWL